MTPEKQQEWNNWIHNQLKNRRDEFAPQLKFRRKLSNEELEYVTKLLKEYYIIHPNFMTDHYGDTVCFCLWKL